MRESIRYLPVIVSCINAFVLCCQPAVAGTISIVNPGAETGDLTGWNVTEGNWHASNVNAPREGAWYFEVDNQSQSLDPFGGHGLFQTIDVTHLTGTIQELDFSVSIAASHGRAETLDSDGLHTWSWWAGTNIFFFDADMNRLVINPIGFLRQGTDPLEWWDLPIAWPADGGPGWEENKDSIAFLGIGLGAGWYNDQTGNLESPPTGSIIDIPEATRFDDIAVTIPEPSTLALLGIASSLLFRSRRR